MMNFEIIIVFSVLAVTLALFVWGRLRHDVVAVIALMILVITDVVSAEEAFQGFADPAVITVAMVLVVSSGLQNSGLIDLFGRWMMKAGKNPALQLALLTILVALVSGFMNDVGALAILMPVAVHLARKNDYSPSLVLMPLAFGSLLGGMTTLIGTPPNIIIANFRASETGVPFSMFDFAPVGVGMVLAGLLFITTIGWRWIPQRQSKGSAEDRFKIKDYITEVRITEDSKLTGKSLSDFFDENQPDIQALGLIRNNRLIKSPVFTEILKSGDILVIEADSDNLQEFLSITQVQISTSKMDMEEIRGFQDMATAEVVVPAESPIINSTARKLRLRSRYGINLLAIGHRERKITKRINQVRFQTGDVLLLQGPPEKIHYAVQGMHCLPLADRGFTIEKSENVILGVGIFGLAIVLVLSGLLKVQIAFTLAATLMLLTRLIEFKEVYNNIDWPIIVLLGAMLPVGKALETSGGADLIAHWVLMVEAFLPVWAVMGTLLLVTMLLSGVINNAATAVLMCPIALQIARGMQVSVDPFLMVVAIGSSSAFLTPIGHQSNTLVMGPGGYKFSDYLWLGIPMTLLVLLCGIPLIMYFWPL